MQCFCFYVQISLFVFVFFSSQRSSRGRVIKPRLKTLVSYYNLSPECTYRYDHNGSVRGFTGQLVPVIKPVLPRVNILSNGVRVKEIKRISSKDSNSSIGASLIDNDPLQTSSSNSKPLTMDTSETSDDSLDANTDQPVTKSGVEDTTGEAHDEGHGETSDGPNKRPAKMRRSSLRNSLKNSKLNDSLSMNSPSLKRVHFDVNEDDTVDVSNVWTDSDIRRLREYVYTDSYTVMLSTV